MRIPAGVTPLAQKLHLLPMLARRLCAHAWQKALRSPLLRWLWSTGPVPERLLIAPQDLRTCDPTRANEIYAGRFAFAGKTVACETASPFTLIGPTQEWTDELLGFSWLRHLRAADTSIARANARALVDDWIRTQGTWHRHGWAPEVLSRRLINWCCQAPLLLVDADHNFYRRFLRTMIRQVRYLERLHRTLPPALALPPMVALTYAGLCLSGQDRLLASTMARLETLLGEQILPDGGHISRNPEVIIDLLLLLLPLRQAFSARNIPPPAAVLNAIDRMMPMLRFFRHGDGVFAHFNGMGPTFPDMIATLLAYDDTRGRPVLNAMHSGYQRLEAQGAVLLMECGAPPPMDFTARAHAGTAAIEFSSNRQRIIVGCGLPAFNRVEWQIYARASAAHSTATLGDQSSSHFLKKGTLSDWLGAVLVSGPRDVQLRRDERDDGTVLTLRHDGYSASGTIHQRMIRLHVSGERLDGDDRFEAASSAALSGGEAYTLRFHLHPTIRARRLGDGNGAVLDLPNGESWIFSTDAPLLNIEESVYLGGTDGPRRTLQLEIRGSLAHAPRIRWAFARQSFGS